MEAANTEEDRALGAASIHTPPTILPMPTEWVDGGDDFKAQFPVAPDREEKQVPFDGGSARQVTYSAHVGDAWFRVVTSDYDIPGKLEDSVVRRLLEEQAGELIDLTARLQDGTEVKRGWVEQGEHQAFEFVMRVTKQDNGTHYWRMLMVGDRMYQVVAHVPDGQETDHKDRFFKGFAPG